MKYERGLFLYNANVDNGIMEQKLAQTLPIVSKGVKKLTVIRTESLAEVKHTCAEYAAKVDIVIILGGDGTLHECINSLAPLNNRPIIAVLPGGTCNDFSRMLNIPQNLYQAAEMIITGEEADIDIGKSADKYFLNFWGIGLISQTSLNIDNDQKKRLGVLSYFLSTLKTINHADPFSYKIAVNGKTHEGESVMILVLNGKYIGTREFPLQAINSSDGKLDIVVIKNSTLGTFRELLSMGSPNTNSEQMTELTHFQAESASITTDQEKEIDMDGEIDGVTPADIKILPNHLRMISNSP